MNAHAETTRGSQPVVTDWSLRQISANELAAQVALVLFGEGLGGDAGRLQLTGGVEGPTCPFSRTLATQFRWRPSDRESSRSAAAAVFLAELLDVCRWEPIHPFLYHGTWGIAGAPDQHSFRFGCRILHADAKGVRLNGQPFRFRGLAGLVMSKERSHELHDWGCNLLTDPQGSIEIADAYGPFITADLPAERTPAIEQVARSGPRRPAIGVRFLPDVRSSGWTVEDVDQLRARDRTILFAERVAAGAIPDRTPADVLFVRGSEPELSRLSVASPVPWVAEVETALDAEGLSAAQWMSMADQLDTAFGNQPGCVGWVARPKGRDGDV